MNANIYCTKIYGVLIVPFKGWCTRTLSDTATKQSDSATTRSDNAQCDAWRCEVALRQYELTFLKRLTFLPNDSAIFRLTLSILPPHCCGSLRIIAKSRRIVVRRPFKWHSEDTIEIGPKRCLFATYDTLQQSAVLLYLPYFQSLLLSVNLIPYINVFIKLFWKRSRSSKHVYLFVFKSCIYFTMVWIHSTNVILALRTWRNIYKVIIPLRCFKI